MTTYEPGTVAVVTDKFGRSGRGICNTKGGWDFTTEGNALSYYSGASEVVEVRPLVVVDPALVDHVCEVSDFVEQLRAMSGFLGSPNSTPRDGWSRILASFADQIEAQTKPPRIPEPGSWGAVLAGLDDLDGKIEFVRYGAGPYWLSVSHVARRWEDLIDPTLIREGLS